MADLSTIYASALFDLYIASGASDEYLTQAILLRDTLGDDECNRFLVHSHISDEDKCAFLNEIFTGNINDDLFGFLHLTIDKNREDFIIPALTVLIDMIKHHQGKATAKVISAAELDEQQISQLEKLLSKKLNKKVDVLLKVDPSLIGGLYIQVDGYFIDRTIKKQLYDLKVSTKEGCKA